MAGLISDEEFQQYQERKLRDQASSRASRSVSIDPSVEGADLPDLDLGVFDALEAARKGKSTMRGLGAMAEQIPTGIVAAGGKLAGRPLETLAATADVVAAGNPIAGISNLSQSAKAAADAARKGGSIAEMATAFKDQFIANLAPVTSAVRQAAPGLLETRVPGVADVGDAAMKELHRQQAVSEANAPEGTISRGLYDLAGAGIQMLPAAATGIATRNPAAALAVQGAVSGGQYIPESLDKTGGKIGPALARAVPLMASEVALSAPVQALLALPAKVILKSGMAPKILKTIVGPGGGVARRGAATALAEGFEEMGTQSLQEAYDSGILDEKTTLGEALGRIGYAGLLGAGAGGVIGGVRGLGDRGGQADEGEPGDDITKLIRKVPDGEGGEVFVAPDGTPLGDTEEQARAAIAKASPEARKAWSEAAPPDTSAPAPDPQEARLRAAMDAATDEGAKAVIAAKIDKLQKGREKAAKGAQRQATAADLMRLAVQAHAAGDTALAQEFAADAEKRMSQADRVEAPSTTERAGPEETPPGLLAEPPPIEMPPVPGDEPTMEADRAKVAAGRQARRQPAPGLGEDVAGIPPVAEASEEELEAERRSRAGEDVDSPEALAAQYRDAAQRATSPHVRQLLLEEADRLMPPPKEPPQRRPSAKGLLAEEPEVEDITLRGDENRMLEYKPEEPKGFESTAAGETGTRGTINTLSTDRPAGKQPGGERKTTPIGKLAGETVGAIPRASNVTDTTFDVEGDKASIRKLYPGIGEGRPTKTGLRFAKSKLARFREMERQHDEGRARPKDQPGKSPAQPEKQGAEEVRGHEGEVRTEVAAAGGQDQGGQNLQLPAKAGPEAGGPQEQVASAAAPAKVISPPESGSEGQAAPAEARGPAGAADVQRPPAGVEGEGAAAAGPGIFLRPGGVRRSAELLAAAYRADPGTELSGAPASVKLRDPATDEVIAVPVSGYARAQRAAQEYMLKAGMEYSPPTHFAKADPARGARIADAYTAMDHAPGDPQVWGAYQKMAEETIAQYEAMLASGITVEFYPDGVDPYPLGPRQAVMDVVVNRHMYVFPTDSGFGTEATFDASGSPLLAMSNFKFGERTARINDLFRAVHDYFGHIAWGNGFRADGEENAWRSHSSMYSPLARRAMTSETRGQNSWLNFGPHGEKNRTASTADTIFADQKTGLLPDWAVEDGAADAESTFKRRSPSVARSTTDLRANPAAAKKRLGLDPEKNRVRQIGEALHRDTLVRHGKIDDKDMSDEASEKIARAMAQEVQFQLESSGATGTGAGWYSTNYPAAVRALAKRFPELATDKNARDVFTTFVAITSNGEKVKTNINNAIDLYEAWRGGRSLDDVVGTRRAAALDNNLQQFRELLKEMERLHGKDAAIGKAIEFLLEPMPVSEINKEVRDRARRKGEDPSKAKTSDYPADATLPRSAVLFGPKIGAFWANLMGSEGYLTMDLWWSRTFNRMRGTLLPVPTATSRARLVDLLRAEGKQVPSGISDQDLYDLAEPYRKEFADRGYKGGTPLEKAANGWIKPAFLMLEEAPFRTSDRGFMIATAHRAQQMLAKRGVRLSIADIQAALWYYEKRLYTELGGRKSDDIGYEEAIKEAASGDRSERPAAPADFGDQGVDDAGRVRQVGGKDSRSTFKGGVAREKVRDRAVRAPKGDGLDGLRSEIEAAFKEAGEVEVSRLKGHVGEAIERIAALFGKKVVVFRYSQPGRSGEIDGAVLRADPNTIYLNENAEHPHVAVLMHEMLHAMKRTRPDLYEKLRAAIEPLIRNKGKYRREQMGDEGSAGLVTEEIIADVLGDHGSNPQFWADLQDRLQDRSLWRQLVDYVKRYIAHVIDATRPLGSDKFVRDFESVYDTLLDVSEAYARGETKAFAIFDSRQAKDAENNIGTYDPNDPRIRFKRKSRQSYGPKPPVMPHKLDEEATSERVGRRLADDMNRMLKAQETIKARGGTVDESRDVYVKENLARSKARTLADKIEDTYWNPIIKTMKKAGLDLKAVDDFLLALHAHERNKVIAGRNANFPDGGSGMTNAEATRILQSTQGAKRAALANIAGLVRQLHDAKLSMMEAHGVLTDADAAALRSMYKHYVPLKTVDVESADQLAGQGRGVDIRGQEYQMAMGRGSRATSPLLVSFQDFGRSAIRSYKNDVGQALWGLAQDPAAKGIVNVADRTEYTIRTTDAAGNVVTQIDPNWTQAEDIFATKIAGETKYLTVRDPQLLEQLKRMGDAQVPDLLRGLGTATSVFGRLLTQYNPTFAPTNIIRDAIQASILALSVPGLNPLTVLKNVPGALWNGIVRGQGKMGQRYQEFLEDGGSTNSYGLSDIRDFFANIEAEGIDSGQVPATAAGKVGAKVRKGTVWLSKTPVAKFLENYNEAFENAVRLATYSAMRDLKMSRQQAAFTSKELSTNFNKKGEFGAVMNAVYVFMNATMQSNRTLVRLAKNPKIRAAIITLVAAGVLQDLLGAAMGGDDDETGETNLDELSDFTLDHNLVVVTSDKDQLKLPLPYGLNLPFVVGRRISKAFRTFGQEGRGMAELLGITGAFVDTFSPIGGVDVVRDDDGTINWSASGVKFFTPTLGKPFADIGFNSDFMGRPVYKEPSRFDVAPKPYAQSHFRSASELSTSISDFLSRFTGGDDYEPGWANVPPEVLDHLAGSYAGGAGRTAGQLMDIGAKAFDGKLDDVEARGIPLVNRFVSEDTAGAIYGRYRIVSQQLEYDKERVLDKDADPAQRRAVLMKLSPERRAALQLYIAADKRLGRIRKIRKAALAAGNEARVKEADKTEQALMKKVIKAQAMEDAR